METNFVINDFEGPLDLLLHLIKTNKMDIYDISISKITEEYLDFINKRVKNKLNSFTYCKFKKLNKGVRR